MRSPLFAGHDPISSFFLNVEFVRWLGSETLWGALLSVELSYRLKLAVAWAGFLWDVAKAQFLP